MASPHVAIVGTGVIRATSAFDLSQAGARVTLIDSGIVGGGTSSRCDRSVPRICLR